MSAGTTLGDTGNWREELRREYSQTLPAKLSKLASLVEGLTRQPDDRDALEALIMAVHRLHGSGGSFGFAEVSRLCGEWELELRQAQGERLSALQVAQLDARLQALRGVLAPAAPVAEEDPAGALLLGLRAALGREPRVLLIEDDPDMAAFLSGLLASLQIGVTGTSTAAEALHAFASGAFDFVVSDYRLAEGTAKQLVRELRARDPEVPVLVVSGEVDKSELLELIRESVDEFQEKPVDVRAFTGAAVRLLLLGSERRRTRRRGAALLELSSHVRLGMPAAEISGTFARLVPEITPFRAAAVALLDEGGGRLRRAATHGWPQDGGDSEFALDELRARYERGQRLDVAAFVPAADAGTTARGGAWRPGDRIVVAVASGAQCWGYLLVDSPLDGRRPSNDSLRMLALLARQLAAALEDDALYAAQMRLNFQLRFSRELVRAALGTSDVAKLKPMLTSAAVGGLGGSFAAFAERTSRGWRLDDVACKRTEDYLEAQSEPGPHAARVFAHVEKNGTPFHWRAADGAVSLAGRRRTQAVLAVPVRADDVLRYVLVIEEDEQGEFDEATVRAYVGLADQVGLILSRLHYQKYLETSAAELRESYGKLRTAHVEVVRLQELLRASLPPATWNALVAGAGSTPLPQREAAASAIVELHVAGFGRLAERLPAGAQITLLDRFFGAAVPAARAAGGEVLKSEGAGLLLRFDDCAAALRALPALLALDVEPSAEWPLQGLPALSLVVGAAYGAVAFGHANPSMFHERASAGEPVAEAARLVQQARPGSALVDARLLPDGTTPEDFGLVALPGRHVLASGGALLLLTLREHEGRYVEMKSPGRSAVE